MAPLVGPLSTGIPGKPTAGAGGNRLCGTLLTPVKRGAVPAFSTSALVWSVVDSPKDPWVSKLSTIAAPKWSYTREYPARMLLLPSPNTLFQKPELGVGE